MKEVKGMFQQKMQEISANAGEVRGSCSSDKSGYESVVKYLM